jgi:hypothetical protein
MILSTKEQEYDKKMEGHNKNKKNKSKTLGCGKLD